MSTMQRVQKYHILTRYSYLDMICPPSAVGLLQSLGVKWRRWREWKGQGHGPRGGGKALRRIDFPPPMQWQDQRDSPRLAGEAAHFRRGDPASSPPASPVSPPLRLLAPSKAASRPRQTRPPDQLTEREGETNRRTGPRRRTTLHSAPQPRPPASGHHYHFTGLNRGHTQIRGQV